MTPWSEKLQPRGTETRLGQALADELRLYHDAPLAGVVVITDGAKRRHRTQRRDEPAKEANVPLYTIGVGSTRPQRNVALRDLVVPTRAFPDDTLNVTGYLQANGYAGRSVDVELTRRRSKTQPAAARLSPSNAWPWKPTAKWSPPISTSNPTNPARSCISSA